MKLRYVLYGAAIIVTVFYLLSIVTLGVNYPILLVVTGDSMKPALNSYDLILLEPIQDKPHIGDIVLIDYTDKNNLFSNYDYVVHRITKLWDKDGIQYMQTKGDNSKYPEYATESSRVLAKVSGSIPYAGFFLWPPANFAIIGAALFAFVYFRK